MYTYNIKPDKLSHQEVLSWQQSACTVATTTADLANCPSMKTIYFSMLYKNNDHKSNEQT